MAGFFARCFAYLFLALVLIGVYENLMPCASSAWAVDAGFEQRRQAYLDFCTQDPRNGAVYAEIARLELNRGPLVSTGIQGALDFIRERRDTSDFLVVGLLRILNQYSASPLLSVALRDEITQTLLGFKYWLDEPGADGMVYWSENHQILYHAAEYLAGQFYPDLVFSNSGLTGRAHKEKARPLILDWLAWRGRVGFSEWHSNVYYDEDIAALLSLVDFAQDSDVATRAAMVLDLLFFDIALNSHHGVFGSTHGRSYEKNKMRGADEDTASISKLLWGEGLFNSRSSMSAVSLATSRRYRIPQVLSAIGQDHPDELIDRERMGIRLEDAAEYGLTYHDHRSGIFWWGMGGYAPWQVVDLTVDMADTYRLWQNEFFRYFEFTRYLRNTGILPLVAWFFYPLTQGSVLAQVNTYTYRTPDAMLSSAQDYNPGILAFQQHLWQATLDTDALVFTTHPGNLQEELAGNWTGSASMPRVGQYLNVLISIYNPILKGVFPRYTHAYFPQSAFDEVTEKNGWIFGRKGTGYVALFSRNPTRWQDTGRYTDKELIADGEENIWICEVGRQAVDGSFDEFVENIASAPLRSDGLRIYYESPSQGVIAFGWDGPLLVNGEGVDIHNYPRYDNPYSQTDFGELRIVIRRGRQELALDFANGTRTIQD